MEMQVREFASLTGVSIRTLHYYDEIGLLRPAHVDEATGYRFYDEQSLMRMQEILFYRELDFPLKSIREILSSPRHDTSKALADQKVLLTLKKQRIERLISAIDDAMKGENVMNAFDNTDFENYKAEASKKWGHTEAYRQHEEKTRDYSGDKWQNLAGEMDRILNDFALCMTSGKTPDSPEAQQLVKALQEHISGSYYDCTKEILAGLGQMYTADERFRRNIDKHREGTAAFISSAIWVYTGK